MLLFSIPFPSFCSLFLSLSLSVSLSHSLSFSLSLSRSLSPSHFCDTQTHPKTLRVRVSGRGPLAGTQRAELDRQKDQCFPPQILAVELWYQMWLLQTAVRDGSEGVSTDDTKGGAHAPASFHGGPWPMTGNVGAEDSFEPSLILAAHPKRSPASEQNIAFTAQETIRHFQHDVLKVLTRMNYAKACAVRSRDP